MFSEILKNKGLTINDISKGAGIPRSTISDLVSGKTSVERMSVSNLKKISVYLGCGMDAIYVYCCLSEVVDEKEFIEKENDLILSDGLKPYVKNLEENYLIETTYSLKDLVRFKKYTESLRNFYKYRKKILPERFEKYVAIFEAMESGEKNEILFDE